MIKLTVITLLMGICPLALAQNDRPQQDQDNRRSGWDIPDNADSENNRMLDRILKRYPDSDADKDGKLNADEARKFIEKQREQWREQGNWRRQRTEPTFDNVKYGPADKQHFDLYRAETEEPAPLVIFFHGGQFITGDERSTRPFDIRELLAAGISVASIDYRETNEAPFPGPFEDAEAAIQFIRFYAEQLHIDPTRIGAMGDEAGGNLALYLALHDDLFDQETRKQLENGRIKDPREVLPEGPIQLPDPDHDASKKPEVEEDAEDERDADETDKDWELEQEQKEAEEQVDSLDDIVLEELIPWDADAIKGASTRLKGAVALHPIASFDPRAWKQLKLPMNDHERLMSKYLDVRYLEPLNDPDVIKLVERVSPMALISADDPPLLLISMYEDMPLPENTVWTIIRHHPKQAQLIGNALRGKGGDAIIRYKGMRNDPGIRSTQFLTDRLK